MMGSLFVLFLVVMALALKNRARLSIVFFGVALALSSFWFLHHASSTLSIHL